MIADFKNAWTVQETKQSRNLRKQQEIKEKSVMAFTSDGKRNYKCKRCGKWTVEDLRQWNSKPQQKKNICPVCVEKAKLKQLELKERSLYGSYNLI